MDGRDKPDHDNLGTKRKCHNTSGRGRRPHHRRLRRVNC